MQRIKRKNGITLVALIITIIILLILAGVSLSFVFNGGILDKSQQAVNEYENAANNESDILQYINSTLEQKINEINSSSGESFGPVISGSVENLNAADDLYVIDETNNASAMWVASPSAEDSAVVFRMYDNGSVGRNSYDGINVGFRPLVCLQSNVQLEKQQDGSFLLK